MSATNRGAVRHKSDFYETPEALARASLIYLRDRFSMNPDRVLDPGAGKGVWGRVARELWPDAWITGVDIAFDAPECGSYNEWIRQDFAGIRRADRPDLIVGNPPFRSALAFIEAARRIVHDRGLVMFLLRLNFLASKRRYAFWKKNAPCHPITCVERPGFTDDGGKDATEYAFFVWGQGIGHGLHWLSWEHRE